MPLSAIARAIFNSSGRLAGSISRYDSMSLRSSSRPTVVISNGAPSPLMIQYGLACNADANFSSVGALGFRDVSVMMLLIAACVTPIRSAISVCFIPRASSTNRTRSPMLGRCVIVLRSAFITSLPFYKITCVAIFVKSTISKLHNGYATITTVIGTSHVSR